MNTGRFVVRLGKQRYWSHSRRTWVDLEHATWYATQKSAEMQARILPGSRVEPLHCPCH